MKPKLFIDMDNTLVDFQTGIDRVPDEIKQEHWNPQKQEYDLDEVRGIFSLMDPMPGAIDAIRALQNDFDIYILSTAPWKNPSAWSDKLEWVQRYFANVPGVDPDNKGKQQFYKRLILAHHKDLLFHGNEYLIDDRPNNGAKEFGDHWIWFGENWFKANPDEKNPLNHLSEDQKRQCWADAIKELKKRVKKHQQQAASGSAAPTV